MRTRIRYMVAALAAAGALFCGPALASALPQLDVSGATPSATSIEISRASFPAGCTTVVIAEETAWRDQLTGSGLAGAVGGPLLLTSQAVSSSLVDELARLGATRAYVLGRADLSSQIASSVAAALPAGSSVSLLRTDDPSRGARLAARLIAAERLSTPSCALVVNPNSWAGAIAAAGPAAARWPVLFADSAQRSANASMLVDLGITRAIVVGGAAGTLNAEEAVLRDRLGATNVVRVTGADRYSLARTIAREVAPAAGLGYSAPVVVSGATGPEAVLAGTFAARRGSATLLSGPGGVGASQQGDLFARRRTVTSLAFVGSTKSLPVRTRTEVQHALRARTFSADRSMSHVKALAGLGPRRAGGSAERRAAKYVATKLRSYGYTATMQEVRIPGGKTSQNVIAQRRGTTGDVIVLGAHLDSKYPSPGANDNASGVAVTLELARCLAEADGVAPTVRFVFFGAEEISGARSTDHHFGSRHYVKSLSASKRAAIEGMVSIDMVGYGRTFTVRNLKVAPMTTVKSLRSWASFTGQPLPFLKDPSKDGWSDHEAFEFRGIPVAWLEWRNDPVYHTTKDSYRHVSASRVDRTGKLVRGWLLDLTPARVEALKP